MRIDELSNLELLAGLRSFIGDERRVMSQVLAYLGEVDARELYRDEACPSMFDFCVRKLGLSEDQACRRIAVARVGRQFPQVLSAIADGRIHLTSVDRLRPFFTMANVDALIEQAARKPRSEIDLLIASLAPKPDVPESISVLPEQTQLGGLSLAAVAQAAPDASTSYVKPLSETRYVIQLCLSANVRAMLDEVRGMMPPKKKDGELERIFGRALRLLHAKLEKQTRAATNRPRQSRGSADPGHVTSVTRREVYARDGKQCTFVSDAGERCLARDHLELDHVHPRALGGTGDATNIRLRCRAHNLKAAEEIFGREYVKAKAESRTRNARAKVAYPQEAAPKASTDVDASPLDASKPTASSTLEASALETTVLESSTREATTLERTAPQTESEVAAPRSTELRGSAPSDPRTPREIVRAGLVNLSFPCKDIDRVLAQMSASAWTRPLATIMREAIIVLT